MDAQIRGQMDPVNVLWNHPEWLMYPQFIAVQFLKFKSKTINFSSVWNLRKSEVTKPQFTMKFQNQGSSYWKAVWGRKERENKKSMLWWGLYGLLGKENVIRAGFGPAQGQDSQQPTLTRARHVARAMASTPLHKSQKGHQLRPSNVCKHICLLCMFSLTWHHWFT
jgi:hypothetical protein